MTLRIISEDKYVLIDISCWVKLCFNTLHDPSENYRKQWDRTCTSEHDVHLWE